MTVTNRQIAFARQPLNVLFNMKLPDGSAQYPLIRFAQKYNPVIEAYIAAERAISEKYLVKNEEGTGFKIENGQPVLQDPAQREAYEAELKALQDMDADFAFKRLPWSILKGVEIEPALLLALDWVFEDLPAE